MPYILYENNEGNIITIQPVAQPDNSTTQPITNQPVAQPDNSTTQPNPPSIIQPMVFNYNNSTNSSSDSEVEEIPTYDNTFRSIIASFVEDEMLRIALLQSQEQEQPQPRDTTRTICASIDKIKEPTECSVCLSNMKKGDRYYTIDCGHKFHVECLEEWVKRNPICPTCRKDIRYR